jgi:hypothetical protein
MITGSVSPRRDLARPACQLLSLMSLSLTPDEIRALVELLSSCHLSPALQTAAAKLQEALPTDCFRQVSGEGGPSLQENRGGSLRKCPAVRLTHFESFLTLTEFLGRTSQFCALPSEPRQLAAYPACILCRRYFVPYRFF